MTTQPLATNLRAIKGHRELVPALGNAMAAYHRGTAAHCVRVSRDARAIGERLGLQPSMLEALQWAGLLHDVGKLAVPHDILVKPGPLDADEWSEIRKHPGVGADLLLALSPDFEPVASAVRAHHEHWDGTGYPAGLAGREIPLLGRIVSICDVYDALVHQRPYRAGQFSRAQAARYLRAHARSHFDPALVPIVVEVHHLDAVEDAIRDAIHDAALLDAIDGTDDRGAVTPPSSDPASTRRATPA